MDENSLRLALSGLGLSAVRWLQQTGSTNDDAAAWADAGAPDLALFAADEQTSGRGRLGRRCWTHQAAPWLSAWSCAQNPACLSRPTLPG